MSPENAKQFYKELIKLTVEELNILHDMPFTNKTVDISHLEALVDNQSFDYWFKLYLPTILFDKIEQLNKK